MVEQETGQNTAEPLYIIVVDKPVTCALYADKNNFLQQEGWVEIILINSKAPKEDTLSGKTS